MRKVNFLTHTRIILSTTHYQLFSSEKKPKQSQWIYSTKFDEYRYRAPGMVSLYAHINPDTHNASLRFLQHIERAHVVVTNSPLKVHRFLKALVNKQRYAYEEEKLPSSTEMQEKVQPTSLAVLRESIDTRTLQFDTDMQISKMIELEKEFSAKKGESSERMTAKLQKTSKQLKAYMFVRLMQKELVAIKHKQGYPAVLQLKEGLSEFAQLQKNGFHVLFAFAGNQNNIKDCGSVVRMLQHSKMQYEILPCTDNLINAIVSSGLPADRFSVQSFPSQNLQALLARRATMKLTLCFQIETQRLDELIKAVVSILGKEQVVYYHSQDSKYFRGQAHQLQPFLNKHIPTSRVSYLVVAPKLADFNQSLRAELNVRKHILGEIQSNKLNMIEVGLLYDKLKELEKKENKYQIDTYMMAAEMLAVVQDEAKVRATLRRIFPRAKDSQIGNMIEQGKKRVVVDHLKLDQVEPETQG